MSSGFQPSDLFKLRATGTVRLSPDGLRAAYTVIRNDVPRRPVPQVWLMTLADGKSVPLSSGDDPSSNPVWAPNGAWLAYQGSLEEKTGLCLADPNGGNRKFLAVMESTNGPLPSTGPTIAWSGDSERIAYVSAVPGPGSENIAGEPIVIKTYYYKPGDKEGNSRFNDNKRLHIFVVEIGSGQIRQLTDSLDHEHSVNWSPAGNEISYISMREPDSPDGFLNNVLFVLNVSTGASRRLTASENAAYRPQFSPDGRLLAFEANTRGLNGLEPTMENTHLFVMNLDGSGLRELTSSFDYRIHEPSWAPGGGSMLTMVDLRGSVHLYRIPLEAGEPAAVVEQPGSVLSYSAHQDKIAYVWEAPGDEAQLFVKEGGGPAHQLTDLNRNILQDRELAHVEPLTFVSNDHKWQIEAFLTYPANFDPGRTYPLVVTIHGGPHWQQGPSFNFKNQVYASRGIATLMVNYRGSTGYGQAFTDAIFRNQNGDEALDILYGVSAATRRHAWIDPERLGIEGISYGGQLGAWLITQTNKFSAAVLTAPVTNLVSFAYSTNYRQYEQTQWGEKPHQGDLINLLWDRSPLRHAARARTPTLFLHGEDDSDVPITESEQFYTALKEIGTETEMVRYVREGHGIREPKHVADAMERSLAWYETFFETGKGERAR